jgi:hypothetical protein
MKIGIDLTKHSSAILPLSHMFEEIEFDVMMVLNDYTKRDLKDLILILSHADFSDSFDGIVKELRDLLKTNEGLRDREEIRQQKLDPMTPLDQFFSVEKGNEFDFKIDYTGVEPPVKDWNREKQRKLLDKMDEEE